MRGVKLSVLMMVLALAGLVLLATACAPGNIANGGNAVTFVLGGVVPEGTATVAVSVTGDGIATPITGEFHLVSGEWQWVVADNPTIFGESRVFTFSAVNTDGDAIGAEQTVTLDVPEALTRVVL